LTPLFCSPGCYCKTKESLEAYAARARPPRLCSSIVIAEKTKGRIVSSTSTEKEIRRNLRERHSFAAPREKKAGEREVENSHFEQS
jgi:hypothetical protein